MPVRRWPVAWIPQLHSLGTACQGAAQLFPLVDNILVGLLCLLIQRLQPGRAKQQNDSRHRCIQGVKSGRRLAGWR